MAVDTLACPSCKKSVEPAANFCGACALPLAGLRRLCPSTACRALNPVGQVHCSRCATALPKLDGSTVLVRWDLNGSELARRIVLRDLGAAVDAKVLVGRSSHALVYRNGRLVVELPPGLEELGRSPLEALTTPLGEVLSFEVIYTPAGEFELPLRPIEAFTADPLRVEVRAALALRIADPRAFVEHRFRDLDLPRLLKSELADALHDDAREAVESALRSVAVEARRDELESVRAQLQAALASRLQERLAGLGLRLVTARVTAISQADLERRTGRKAELLVILGDQVEALDRRKRLFDARSQTERQALYEEQAALRHEVERLEVLERERELLLRGEHSSLQALAAMEKLRQDSDVQRNKQALSAAGEKRKDGLIGEASLADLAREIELARDDDARGRRIALERLDLEHRRAMLALQADIEAFRAQKLRAEQFADALHGDQVGGLQRDARRKEIDLALDEAERRQRLQLVREREQAENTARLLEAKARKRAIELEAAKGLSYQQILALQATKLPFVDRILNANADEKLALVEQHKQELLRISEAMAADHRQVLERLLETLARRQDDEIARTERLGAKAMDRMADVAVAKSASASPAPSLRAPPPPAAPADASRCSACGAALVPGARACGACGAKSSN